ncbi:bacillithiol system redox-active protein YtxJ [Formosa haliotis]|uniref:bacillithiol system redox-active protein YtxJ n=1 Tax=Formosa haliotis TaxID=1555194 RepID=UPI00082673D7|nr:bacillithiol system redox-active protein YtxJ [Formosa haliotis]
MGLFDKMFGGKSEKVERDLPWKPLVSIGQLEDIKNASNERPQVLFKHSTRCGISRMVLSQFEKDYNNETDVDLYFLDLLQHRDVSNAIAEQFNVYHESPQLLIVKNGIVVKHASHGSINNIDLTTI